MDYFLCLALLTIGIILIIKCGDYFVDAAIWIAEISHIPHFIIGATIVSFCTTLPELIVSSVAAANGQAEMAVGNAIGSVTANTGLILAMTMIFTPFVINRKDYMLRNILLPGTVLLLFLLCITGVLNPYLSLLVFIPLIVFMWDNIKQAKKQMVTPSGDMEKEHNEVLDNNEEEAEEEPTLLSRIIKIVSGVVLTGVGISVLVLFRDTFSTLYVVQIIVALVIIAAWLTIFELGSLFKINKKCSVVGRVTGNEVVVNVTKLIAGIAGIVIGSNLLVDYGSMFASLLHVPEIIIAVTIVAIGTSLPELITTINAIIKKNSSLSAGNIVGANIIDICLILPICAIIGAANGLGGLLVTKQSLYLDFPFCLGIVAIATIPPLFTKKFDRWQGIVCLVAYVVYLVLCVLMGQGIIFA
ncbi:MAG: calcium/sodium antiporter [Clostridiales bacterium]|nr:calcium/sodium antiporter [Clostridiales bacterium]